MNTCNNKLKRPAKQVAVAKLKLVLQASSLTYYAEEFACGGWLVSHIYSGVYRLNVEPENQR